MTVATTADAQVLIGEQSGFGSEASSYFKMPFTAESINFVSDTVVSEEITSDRAIKDVIRVATGAEGDINFELQYHSAIDLLLEGALGNDFGGDTLTEGTTTKFYSIEKNFKIAGANQQMTFMDMAVGSFSVEAEIGSLIAGTAGFLGGTVKETGGNPAFDTDSPSSVATATTGAIFSSADTTTLFKLGDANGGSPTTQTNVQAFSFAIDNGLRQQRAIGDKNIVGIGLGRFNVTGSMTMHFDNIIEMNKFLSDDAREMELHLTDGTRGYIFKFPQVKYTSAEVVAGSVDEDIVVSFELQKIEGTAGHTLEVTRDPS